MVTSFDYCGKHSGLILFNGILLLKMNTGNATTVLVEVIDMAGKLILTNEYIFSEKENTTEINLEKFANGVYFIKLVTSDKATQTIRVVKE